MVYFNPKGTRVYRAVAIGRIISPKILHPTVIVGVTTTLVFVGLWVTGIGYANWWHLMIISVATTYALWVYTIFFETYLGMVPPHTSSDQNLADFLDYQAMKIATAHADGNISQLLLPMLEVRGFSFVLMRMGISSQDFKRALLEYLHTHINTTINGGLVFFLHSCLTQKRTQEPSSHNVLSWQDLFFGLCTHSDFLKKIIFDVHIECKDARMLLAWQEQDDVKRMQHRRFWKRSNLMHTRGIGHDWTSGYTARLEQYATKVTELPSYAGFSPRLYGHTAETEQVERILARDGKSNAILVGEKGIGKTIIVSALAKRLALGQSLGAIAYKHILKLDVGALLAGSNNTYDIEERFRLLFADALRAGNIILFVEDIHMLFDSSGAVGTINAGELLLPFLTSARLQIIGLTTPEHYHKTIAKDQSLLQAFEKVEVREPAKENVYAILRDVVPHIEAHEQVWILFQAIHTAIELSDRYIKTAPFPEKAIALLQESAVYALTKRHRLVTASDVEAVTERKTGVPLGTSAHGAESSKLLSLEKDLHTRVVGQDDAISAIANAMRRARSGISSEKKPIGGFLFLGPTGVGKTETAKALAVTYFGSEEHMIRFDMSEYQNSDSLSRMIGHDDEGGLLATQIIDHPFSLVLLDEIEKAHPKILDVFLQVLDDGRLTDALGRTADFTNAIIIATSNAGAEMIRESEVGKDGMLTKEKILDRLQKQGVFRPEFLNRFDAIVIFKPLTPSQEEHIATLMFADLNRRLKEKGITVSVDEVALKKVVSMGFSKEFGARSLRRVMQDTVENSIAKKLLSGEITRGSTFVLTAQDLN